MRTLPAFIQDRESLPRPPLPCPYTNQFLAPRLTPHPFHLSELPPLPKNLRKPGTPSIIILCLSGMRCVDVIRSLKTMEPKPPGEISKLFAKHFKVPEQIEYLKEKKVWVGVGTPGRIGKILAESGECRPTLFLLLRFPFHSASRLFFFSVLSSDADNPSSHRFPPYCF